LAKLLASADALSNTTTNTYDAHASLLTVTSPTPNSNRAGSEECSQRRAGV
jgi:hypothetical protein